MALIQLPLESHRGQTLALITLISLGAVFISSVSWMARSVQRDSAVDTRTSAPPAATEAMLARPSPVDIGFAQDMSVHHEQALTMAHLALTKASPRVRLLAQGVITQQLKEVGYMQGWLLLWHAPGMAANDDMRWMREAYARTGHRDATYEQFIDSCAQGRGMPGMASPQELEALAVATSPAGFDAAFLALMVRHHQGAVVMARFVSEHAQLELVRGFASAMAAEQQQEMAQMLKWLKAS